MFLSAQDMARALDRPHEAGLDSAAADMGQRGGDVGLAGVAVVGEQGGGGHDQARRAKAALDRLLGHEGLLDGVAAVGREAFDGGHAAALGLAQ